MATVINNFTYGRMTSSCVRAWAQELLARPDLAVLDTETTGNWGDEEITEIDVIDRTGATLFHSMFRPVRPIAPDASRITGITDAMLARSPRFVESAQELAQLLHARPVLIYNADYDTKVLRLEYNRCRLPTPHFEAQCAMLAYAAYRGEPNPRGSGYQWHKLSAACQNEGIHIAGAHRSRADCLSTLALLECIAR